MDFDHLSIWEIAHRWHDVDPNTSDPQALPLPVQDLLRVITNMQIRHFLPVLKKSGVQLKDEQNFISFEAFMSQAEKPEDLENEDLWLTELREDYFEQQDRWCSKHNAVVDGLDKCFRGRVFDKEKLESIHLDRGAIRDFCREKELDLPAFWFTKSEREQFNSEDGSDTVELPGTGKIKQDEADRFWSRLINAQQHRLLCREIAKVLWANDPEMSQVAVIDHQAIREYGGGRFYSDPNTVRNWIKDLDPRPEDKRQGRKKD
ncbi:hypothetical protein EHN06_10495 [Marinobacter sp. NP-4(2019)]|uniref:hypothetical protein n=1 Tax=Marinobacter sp. NP-4(2019) TaxID=2488665 RepID=UPI000FC3F075|nr:hypothetical protein [Marinobacter sp. NP-4(2019)]AZT83934.1 hypothetical protein EHN06_10495 [Marinobacter sp. NP-4(2019)]